MSQRTPSQCRAIVLTVSINAARDAAFVSAQYKKKVNLCEEKR